MNSNVKTIRLNTVSGNLLHEMLWRYVGPFGSTFYTSKRPEHINKFNIMHVRDVIKELIEHLETDSVYKRIYNFEDYISLMYKDCLLKEIINEDIYPDGENTIDVTVIFSDVPDMELKYEDRILPRSYHNDQERREYKTRRRFNSGIILNYPPPSFWETDKYYKRALKLVEEYNDETPPIECWSRITDFDDYDYFFY